MKGVLVCLIGLIVWTGNSTVRITEIQAEQMPFMKSENQIYDCLSTDEKAFGEYLKQYAPVIYQDVNANYDVRADLLTRFDVDGDWKMDNQWNTIGKHPQKPYVYTSVQETNTHLFLG